jgi:hypothetical protein
MVDDFENDGAGTEVDEKVDEEASEVDAVVEDVENV